MAKPSLEKLTPKGERTRQQIVATAVELFVSQGYHATTTRQITDQLGMARGAIYNHFPGKYDIFVAGLNAYHPWIHIPAAVEAAEGETLEEFVHNAADRLLVAWDKNPEMIRLHLIELIEFQGRHLPTLFEKVFEQVTESLRKIVKERQELGKIPVANLSRAILGLFFAYLMTDRFTGATLKTGFDQTSFDYFTDAYLHGVIARETGTH
jgi:AcrR family transcriptional regulator